MAENHVLDVPADRWVLLHFHIFKNAGSTIDSILRRCLGPRFATLHGPTADSTLTGVQLASFLAANPDIAAVSSHHLAYPFPQIPGIVLFDICFLRNPLMRLWSMYRYMRATDTSDHLAHCARTTSAPEFFDLLLSGYPHLINDAQVNLLANGRVYTRPPTAQDLRLAMGRARQISVLGTVELFDESAVTAEYFLRPTFPMVRFEHAAQNASPPEHGAPSEEAFREAIGPARFAQLEHMNRLDAHLLAFAKDELLRRFEMVPDRSRSLASLRARSKVLENVPAAALAGRG